MTELKKVNRRVSWIPSKVEIWSHGDAWSNEFTSATGNPLDDEQMDAYSEWSEKTVTGTVSDNLLDDAEEFVFIVLDAEPAGLPSIVISYPKEVFANDPAFEICVLSNAEKQVFDVADETNRRC